MKPTMVKAAAKDHASGDDQQSGGIDDGRDLEKDTGNQVPPRKSGTDTTAMEKPNDAHTGTQVPPNSNGASRFEATAARLENDTNIERKDAKAQAKILDDIDATEARMLNKLSESPERSEEREGSQRPRSVMDYFSLTSYSRNPSIDPIPPPRPEPPLRGPGAYPMGGRQTPADSRFPPQEDRRHESVTAPPVSVPHNSNLVEAQPVLDGSSNHEPRQEAEEVDDLEAPITRTKTQQHQQFTCLLLVPLLALSAVVLGLFFVLRNKKEAVLYPTESPSETSSSYPSSAPSSFLESFLTLDLPEATVERILDDPFSPQARGYSWIAEHPNILELPDWRQVQLFALASFYFSFEGPNWPQEIRNSWLLYERHECFWYSHFEDQTAANPELIDDATMEAESVAGIDFGIDAEGLFAGFNDTQCNEYGEITAIILTDMRLADYHPIIPPEIGLLTSLSSIILDFNQIQHVAPPSFVPSDIGLLSELGYFRLWGNNVTDYIPTELGLCKSLVNLDLDSNSYMGTIPTELFSLPLLDEIWLGYNLLTGSIPSEIGNLQNLQLFEFSSNFFTGQFPSEVGLMSNLKWISNNNMHMTGTLPVELSAAHLLEVVWINQNELTGPLPSQLGDIPILRGFMAASNQLSGSLPSEVTSSRHLSQLSLANNLLTGSVPTEIGLATSLIFLEATNNLLSGLLPSSELNKLVMDHSLRYLNLENNTALSGTIPEDVCCLNQQDEFCIFGQWFGLAAYLRENRSCSVGFDCTGNLCGCGCPCDNEFMGQEDFLMGNSSSCSEIEPMFDVVYMLFD